MVIFTFFYLLGGWLFDPPERLVTPGTYNVLNEYQGFMGGDHNGVYEGNYIAHGRCYVQLHQTEPGDRDVIKDSGPLRQVPDKFGVTFDGSGWAKITVSGPCTLERVAVLDPHYEELELRIYPRWQTA